MQPVGESVENPDDSASQAHRGPARWRRNLVVGLLVSTVVASWVGNAFAPALVARHPLTLIGLNPSNRFLVLGGIRTPWVAYVTLATARRMLTVVTYFIVGHWYGERAIRWLERRSPDEGRMVRQMEAWFSRGAWPLIVAMPIGTIGLLAGAAGMTPAVVLAVMGTSILARVVALRLVGHVFSGPVDTFVGWIDRARGPLLVVSIGAVLLMAHNERQRRRSSIEELASLGDEDDSSDADD